MVQGIRLELLLHIPNVACYHYTTSCIFFKWLGRAGLNRRPPRYQHVALPTELLPNILTRRIKITYQFPKQMLIHRLLRPSLCTNGAGERTWTSRTRLLRPLSMPIRVHPHMYWLSSVITTIPVRIWWLVPNQLVRLFGRTYRWDFRLYFSSHCHVPIPYCHHSWSRLYILVMYARLKVPSYRTSWFVNTLWCASSRCHLFATLQRLGAEGGSRTQLGHD